MKCSKDKCKSLHLWRKSPVQPHSLGTDGMGSTSAGKAMGVRGDSRLSMSQQCALAAKQAKSILGCIGSRSREVIIHLYPTLITLHLEYGVLFCPPPPHSTGKTLIKGKEFSRGSPGQLGLEHSPCEEELRNQDSLSLEKRKLLEHLTATLQQPWGGYKRPTARLVTALWDDESWWG